MLTCLLVWVYWNSLCQTAGYWTNPKYSHGYLVPIFTAVLLLMRRSSSIVVSQAWVTAGIVFAAVGGVILTAYAIFGISVESSAVYSVIACGAVISAVIGTFLILGDLPAGQVTPSARWAGLALLASGLLLRLLTTYFPNISPELASFVPSLAGLFLLVGGWPTIRWAGPAIAFLIFMFPLPGVLDTNLLQPLQKLATQCSSCVQTMGIPAHPEGSTIRIGEIDLEVVEACSGLRMLTIFEALCVAVVLVTRPPIPGNRSSSLSAACPLLWPPMSCGSQ